MGGDLVVALGRATVDGSTLFGHNCGGALRAYPSLQCLPGRTHTAGEMLKLTQSEVPQIRQTYRALGSHPPGEWGYGHGLNEHGVVCGCTPIHTRIHKQQQGLLGTDLVRLTLERSHSALQGVEILTGLISRYGQGSRSGSSPYPNQDHAFLIADGREAFAIESSDIYWVVQEIREVRALSNVCTVRQDWNTIARGLASHAIDQGWWPGDGSKLDFAGTVGDAAVGHAASMRRWGRATLLLEQQNTCIDDVCLRRVLSDHYEGCADEVDPLDHVEEPVPLCRHSWSPTGEGTVVSLIAQIAPAPQSTPLAWCAFGPPCISVYFPVLIVGDLPVALSRGSFNLDVSLAGRLTHRLLVSMRKNRHRWSQVRKELSLLQSQLDGETEEFMAEATALQEAGDSVRLHYLASLFMQHNWERCEAILRNLLEVHRPWRSVAAST